MHNSVTKISKTNYQRSDLLFDGKAIKTHHKSQKFANHSRLVLLKRTQSFGSTDQPYTSRFANFIQSFIGNETFKTYS